MIGPTDCPDGMGFIAVGDPRSDPCPCGCGMTRLAHANAVSDEEEDATPSAALVHPTDAAFGDLERREAAVARKTLFWDAVGHLGRYFGVELDLKPRRCAASWDDSYDPPRLLAATVRLARPGYARPARRKR